MEGRFVKNIPLILGAGMIGVLIILMLFGPYLPFVDEQLEPVKHRWSEDKRLQLPPYPPSVHNLLGSDKNGVDLFSKIVMGTKETLLIVLGITTLRYMIAVPLGLLARRQKGLGHVIVQGWNQIFSFIPTILAAVLLLSIPPIQNAEHRLLIAIVVLAVIEVGRVAQVTAERAHQVGKEEYIEAGTALGLSSRRMARSYYLPALAPEVIVGFCIDLGKVMLLIGQLGILQIFLQHVWVEVHFFTPKYLNTSLNWSALLAEHRREVLSSKFGFIFYPAAFIAFSILAFNLLGEGLRRRMKQKYHTTG
ncbi:peptide/nickel transport system permease protein [Paenibacillus aquistagni]|uniref:Peptide/nickel transport system permease protein n=1 Tax=Paenibacillus aquistagni TaxID=1852522 RepID=A0A1X7K4K1_9BACL|nr:peptide/nickel transport system permease protein [Paenibacillus aquistagni]